MAFWEEPWWRRGVGRGVCSEFGICVDVCSFEGASTSIASDFATPFASPSGAGDSLPFSGLTRLTFSGRGMLSMANLVDDAGVEGRSTTLCEPAPLARRVARGTGVPSRSAVGVAAPLGGAGVRACFSGRLPIEFAGFSDIGSPLDLFAIVFGTAQNDSRFFRLAE